MKEANRKYPTMKVGKRNSTINASKREKSRMKAKQKGENQVMKDTYRN